MRHARMAARGWTILGLVLGLGGCGSSSHLRLPLPSSPALKARARQEAALPPGPELRIPQNAVAQVAPEVPIVPLPLPPFNRPGSKTAVETPARAVSAPKEKTTQPRTDPLPMIAMPVPAPTSLPAPSSNGRNNMRLLHRTAAERIAAVDSYIARMTRRETVRGRDKPEEVILFKFRKQPWSLYFKWLSGEGHGREMAYVKDRYDNKLQLLLAAGDIPLAPAGKRLALPPDSILVRTASRHPIIEAGIGANIDRLGAVLDALDRGDKRFGTLKDLGLQVRPEYGAAVPAIEHQLPGGLEPELPNGAQRVYYFDPNTQMPQLIVTRDEKGHEVEYYRYDRLQPNVKLDDDDFDPDRLWGRPKTTAAGQ